MVQPPMANQGLSGSIKQDAGPLIEILHDDLAQLLSLAMIQLDYARHGADPEALERARGLVGGALSSTRGLLARLQDAAVPKTGRGPRSQDLARALQRCAQRLGRASATPLAFSRSGNPAQPAPEIAQVLLAATRELLLNACRHAAGAPVELRLGDGGDPEQVQILVADRGPGLAKALSQARSGHGLGLSSLGSRLAPVGARLRWRADGLGVQASIRWRTSAALRT
ncbi:sensor histidine kinase [Roseateles sp.]|uniref:sensor histidine kinase n=1 Tax=Roseateles sp. TaxID=1971397 RepID=UPI0039189E84